MLANTETANRTCMEPHVNQTAQKSSCAPEQLVLLRPLPPLLVLMIGFQTKLTET